MKCAYRASQCERLPQRSDISLARKPTWEPYTFLGRSFPHSLAGCAEWRTQQHFESISLDHLKQIWLKILLGQCFLSLYPNWEGSWQCWREGHWLYQVSSDALHRLPCGDTTRHLAPTWQTRGGKRRIRWIPLRYQDYLIIRQLFRRDGVALPVPRRGQARENKARRFDLIYKEAEPAAESRMWPPRANSRRCRDGLLTDWSGRRGDAQLRWIPYNTV